VQLQQTTRKAQHRFSSVHFISFRFVSFRLVSFRFVSFVSFRFVFSPLLYSPLLSSPPLLLSSWDVRNAQVFRKHASDTPNDSGRGATWPAHSLSLFMLCFLCRLTPSRIRVHQVVPRQRATPSLIWRTTIEEDDVVEAGRPERRAPSITPRTGTDENEQSSCQTAPVVSRRCEKELPLAQQLALLKNFSAYFASGANMSGVCYTVRHSLPCLRRCHH
jgi:hypothetical protein